MQSPTVTLKTTGNDVINYLLLVASYTANSCICIVLSRQAIVIKPQNCFIPENVEHAIPHPTGQEDLGHAGLEGLGHTIPHPTGQEDLGHAGLEG